MNVHGLEEAASGVLETEGSDNSKLFALEVNNVTIEVAVFNFSHRLLIILTQLGKLGSIISLRQNTVLVGEEQGELYDIRTLLGDDRLDYHVTARTLADSLQVSKPILFGIALKDITFPTVQTIKQALLENRIW